jgi:hypothetical protein
VELKEQLDLTLMLISHDLRVVHYLCDRVAAHRTYSWYRLEIPAALANTALLFDVAGMSSIRPSTGWAAPTRWPLRR